MGNRMQLLIYRLSSAAPLAIAFAIVWYREEGNIWGSLICLGFSIAVTVAFFIFFWYGNQHLSPIVINVTEITQGDGYIVSYIISYLLPLSSMVFDNFNYCVSLVIAVIILLVMPFVNSATPNPLLFVIGYHFYHIGAENGVKDYLLISKQKVRNKSQIKSVKRLFEYVLIDSWR